MQNRPRPHFTRREGQILDVIHRLGEASVADIIRHIPDSPTSGAARRMLNLLGTKGAVEYRHDGARKVYRATEARHAAGRKALGHIVDTFFAGSASDAVAALFSRSRTRLSDHEKSVLSSLIQKTKEKGR